MTEYNQESGTINLTQKDFARIATLKHEEGGGAMLVYVAQRIAIDENHLSTVDPNNAGAVGQLQGRMSAYRTMRALLTAPVVALEEEEEETAN